MPSQFATVACTSASVTGSGAAGVDGEGSRVFAVQRREACARARRGRADPAALAVAVRLRAGTNSVATAAVAVSGNERMSVQVTVDGMNGYQDAW